MQTSTAQRSTGRIGWAIFLLATIGLVLSVVSLVNHYREDPTGYCHFGQSFDCDLVNRSVFSEVAGVPVAAIGILGYALLMFLSRVAYTRRNALLMTLAALIGLGFALHLTYIEARILVVWCVLCIGSQMAILLIWLLTMWQTARVWKTT